MNRRSFIYKFYFAATLLLLFFTVGLRIAACLSNMDYASGYFEDKLLISIANTTLAAAIFFAFSYVLLEERDKKFIFNFSSPLNYVFAGTLATALLFFARHALEKFFYYKDIVELKLSMPFTKDNATAEKLLSYICLALSILALLSVVHFILASMIVKSKNTRRADFGLITVIFLSLYAAYLYFSNELPINAPAKIIDQSAYLASALFFLYETRISIGRERWRAYRAFGLIAMLLLAYSAIPTLVVYLANGNLISNNVYETLLSLALLLFISARLVLTAFLREDAESKTVSLIKAAFSQRIAEINPEKEEEYDPETDEDLQGIVVEDRGEYYELNFEESKDAPEINETESEEISQDEENLGN